jgi:hypothetical protein
MIHCLGFTRGFVMARVFARIATFGNLNILNFTAYLSRLPCILDRLQPFVHVFVEHLPSPFGTVIISILA